MRFVLIFLVLASINLFAAFENFKDPGESEKATCLGNCCTTFKDANPGTRDPEELTRVKYHCKLVTIMYTRECKITCILFDEEENVKKMVTLPNNNKFRKFGSALLCVDQGKEFEGGDNVCNGMSDDINMNCYLAIPENPCNDFTDGDREAAISQYFPGNEYTVTITCHLFNDCLNNYSGN